jgi:hypothetical protein
MMIGVGVGGSGALVHVMTSAAAFLGLGLAAVSIAVTWYLWSKSGPGLKVKTHCWHVAGLVPRLYVEMRNTGRLPTIVRRIECVYNWEGGIPHHVPVQPNEDPLPRELSPTEYLHAERQLLPDSDSLPRELSPTEFIHSEVQLLPEFLAALQRDASWYPWTIRERLHAPSIFVLAQRGDGRWCRSRNAGILRAQPLIDLDRMKKLERRSNDGNPSPGGR